MKMDALLRDLDLPAPNRQTPERVSDAVVAALTIAVFLAIAALLYWGTPV